MALRIAHSNILPTVLDENETAVKNRQPVSEFAIRMARKGFNRSIKKNSARIAEIKKYFPEWEPQFRYPY